MNVMHYDPTKAFSMNLFMYEDLMHNNLASWLNRIDEIVDSGREGDGGLALVRQSMAKYIALWVTLRIVRIFWTRD